MCPDSFPQHWWHGQASKLLSVPTRHTRHGHIIIIAAAVPSRNHKLGAWTRQLVGYPHHFNATWWRDGEDNVAWSACRLSPLGDSMATRPTHGHINHPFKETIINCRRNKRSFKYHDKRSEQPEAFELSSYSATPAEETCMHCGGQGRQGLPRCLLFFFFTVLLGLEQRRVAKGVFFRSGPHEVIQRHRGLHPFMLSSLTFWVDAWGTPAHHISPSAVVHCAKRSICGAILPSHFLRNLAPFHIAASQARGRGYHASHPTRASKFHKGDPNQRSLLSLFPFHRRHASAAQRRTMMACPTPL